MSAREEILATLAPEQRQITEALLAGEAVSYPRRVGRRAIETAVRAVLSAEERQGVAERCG